MEQSLLCEKTYQGNPTETALVLQNAAGKVIRSLKMDGDALDFEFVDGSKMTIWDDGQDCCERRYMTCDDDLKQFEGATFIGAFIKDGPSESDQYGEPHDIQFLEIQTRYHGCFTCVTHNEHNGYYGGFNVKAKNE